MTFFPDTTLLVPLDGTAAATAALPVAETLAQKTGALLRLIHISDVSDKALPPRQLVEQLGASPAHVRQGTLDQLTGRPATALLQAVQASPHPIIVMCNHSALLPPEAVLGHTAAQVIASAACPIVLVRPERGSAPWKLERILVPYDGTPATAAALRPAIDLASRVSATLVVLHIAVPGTSGQGEEGTFAAPRYMDQPHHEWPAWVREFLARLSCLAGLESLTSPWLQVAQGEPGEEIEHYAADQGMDLIVVGWHGRLETGHADTLKHLLLTAPCPVLLSRCCQPSQAS
jgi:nucleotide-binding universal stress UspA family protein